MHFTHMPRTGELSLSKRPRVSASRVGPIIQKGRRKGSRRTDLACDRQISEGHLGGGRGGGRGGGQLQIPRRSPSEIAQHLLMKQVAFTPPDEIEGVKMCLVPSLEVTGGELVKPEKQKSVLAAEHLSVRWLKNSKFGDPRGCAFMSRLRWQ